MTKVAWERLPFAGGYMAGGWQDSHGRVLTALVAGKRGEWAYQIQRRSDERVETLAAGSADKQAIAMRDAIEIVRGYLR